MPDDEDDGVTAGDARADETMGLDRSEQPGLGGEASVLEEYGEDTVPDDLPEPPQAPLEPPLPGTDPDLPKDLEAERGGPDPTLPPKGHELKPGIAREGDASGPRLPEERHDEPESGNTE
jgi:hypothetical protein